MVLISVPAKDFLAKSQLKCSYVKCEMCTFYKMRELNNLSIDLCVYVAKFEQKSFWKSHFPLIGSILTKRFVTDAVSVKRCCENAQKAVIRNIASHIFCANVFFAVCDFQSFTIIVYFYDFCSEKTDSYNCIFL